MEAEQQFIFGAIILILITWGLAMAGKWLVARCNGASLERIVSLFIWLCGLTLILAMVMFGRPGGDVPIAFNEFPDSFGSFVPKIVYVSISFVVGSIIAKIVRDSVATVNFDKWANPGGAEAVTGNSTLSEIISTIVFILLIVSVGIGACHTPPDPRRGTSRLRSCCQGNASGHSTTAEPVRSWGLSSADRHAFSLV